ncbi:Vta1 like-domain-containing protein [Favolaschia claudopus]|uniref:Vta1 like-domain-containing protein n=1 Tax=Favolaschia claudopus TaxID=2862362 RepID=A0AAW0EJ17_9AGAR
MVPPPVPAPLKSIAPYLQRADELRIKEPVVAYWCMYYAAQVGIGLKAKDPPSRDFLFELLGNLEKLKQDIGANDAIDIESASAAFVENFALRVFAMADNEDRSGAGNRSTAKKFLAAANFLEVLTTFPQTEVSDSNEEKIRYAKWKAADIAKAYREGRKPTPGPAGGSTPGIEAELSQLQQIPTPPTFSSTDSNMSGTTVQKSPPSPQSQATPPGGSPPKIKRTSPRMETADIVNANRDFSPQTPPRRNDAAAGHGLNPGTWGGENAGEATPGSWSTAATPGTGTTPQEMIDTPHSPSPTSANSHARAGSASSSSSSRDGGLLLKRDASGKPPSLVQDRSGSTESKKSVHFTPSAGGFSTTDGSPPVSPIFPARTPNEAWQVPNGPVAPNGMDLPLGFVPDPHQPSFISGAQPSQPAPGHPYASAPPLGPESDFYGSVLPSAPPALTPVVPPPPSFVAPPTLVSPPPPLPVPEAVELTPTVIAKAQKHCRFAISALDYEDAEQARRELRAALAVLGG